MNHLIFYSSYSIFNMQNSNLRHFIEVWCFWWQPKPFLFFGYLRWSKYAFIINRQIYKPVTFRIPYISEFLLHILVAQLCWKSARIMNVESLLLLTILQTDSFCKPSLTNFYALDARKLLKLLCSKHARWQFTAKHIPFKFLCFFHQ